MTRPGDAPELPESSELSESSELPESYEITESAAANESAALLESPDHLGDISPQEFRAHVNTLADWIAEYLSDPGKYPVLSRLNPGEFRNSLPQSPPQKAEGLEEIISDIDKVLMPGITHWNHPGFMAFFANTASAPGILAELLSAALNQVGILWRTSPALAELEQTMTAWLRDAMQLPPDWFGMIADTASVSTLQALAASRELHPELAIREKGMAGRSDLPRLRIYTSDQAHSSVDKAAITLGIGAENVVRVASDSSFRMRVDRLREAIADDRAAGFFPLAVVATLGTTSTTSIDPIAEIADVCEEGKLWLHADAAYGGALALLPEKRDLFAGLERADSMVFNPHKWLFTPMDCSLLWTRRPDLLRRAFSLTPAYLETGEQDVALSYSDYSFQLGRRFRALKLWFIIRSFGIEGIQKRIRYHCLLAQRLAAWISETEKWEVSAPVGMSVVCFRYVGDGSVSDADLDEINAAVLEHVNASGKIFISHTRLNGRYTLRIAIGNLRTEEKHVAGAWELVRSGLAEPLRRYRD